MNTFALIVAGGKGLRMGRDLPKQFLLLGGRPVLMHTLSVFHAADAETGLILVLPEEHKNYWKQLCAEYQFDIPHIIADGGSTRFESVRNGLARIEGEGLIAVHDGVRPMVSPELIRACFQAADKSGAVIPVNSVVESLRKLENQTSQAVDRSEYVSVQTPQVFRSEWLRAAYGQEFSDLFTDDASVVEAAGYPVSLIQGERENIKITTPMDLLLAEQLLKH
jgi:2-C-methyl-D-erythritol 4-phosphate cytidylyltransferase